MAGVAEDDDFHIRPHELYLLSQRHAVRALAPDGQNWHSQSRLRKLGKVFRGLRERLEVSPTGAHATRPGVGCDIRGAISRRNRPGAVRGELVPIVIEVVPLAAFDQQLRGPSMKAEVPEVWIVVDVSPVTDPRRKRIHLHELRGL